MKTLRSSGHNNRSNNPKKSAKLHLFEYQLKYTQCYASSKPHILTWKLTAFTTTTKQEGKKKIKKEENPQLPAIT